MRPSAGSVALLGLTWVLATGAAQAQSPGGSLLGRIASVESREDKQSARLLDAGIVTLLRWTKREMPDLPGSTGESSEFRLVATPLVSLLETESARSATSETSAVRFLPLLGARLFESERSTMLDALSGVPVETHRWSFVKLPFLGSLLGAERRGDKTRWSFFFVGPG